MLIRLMNLPRKIQLVLAAALAVLFALLPVCLTLVVLSVLREQSAQIDEMRHLAGKLTALASMKHQAIKIASTPGDQSSSELLIEAENLSIARANLQSRIGAVAAAHGVLVSSSGSVPDLNENGLLLIGIRADISGTNEAIEGVMGEIESSTPPLLVREFVLRSEGALPLDSPPTLTASVRLYGATRASTDALPSSDSVPDPVLGQP